jgi:hypothetical protein
VGAAFAAAHPEAPVPLAELGVTVAVGVAAGFHLLDTVVHTWDVATALGVAFRPDDELVAAAAAVARRVPAGAARERPGPAFGPVTAGAEDPDPWTATLALLGRAAGTATAAG